MNVPDGTECNGGAGSCSMGECIDDNLSDGVDCTSDNNCVQDGTCDPAVGECIPGDPLPVDASCGDGGVCDGAGNCVECNDAGQCPDDGQDCTIAVCQANQCGQNTAMDGTACDFMGGMDDGVCESGICIAAPDCTTNEQCDDGEPPVKPGRFRARARIRGCASRACRARRAL